LLVSVWLLNVLGPVQEHAALMGHLAAAQEAAAQDKAEVAALRQELQLLRPSNASSQQQVGFMTDDHVCHRHYFDTRMRRVEV